MATRLSVISTRTGDAGTTGLGDGSRVPKHDLRIVAMGEVDELNSVVGLWRTEALPADVDTLLSRIQHDLFDLGAELCIPGHTALSDAHVAQLDKALQHYNATLGKLEEFILPGGTRAASLAHVARTVTRRAERAVVALEADLKTQPQGSTTTVNAPVRQYLNRLSDLCFVLARHLNREAGCPDVLWQR